MTSEGPLTGYRVVELGARVSVAGCGGLLAQLGADVVLVEPVRPVAGHKWADRAATATGKRSVVVDGSEPGDRELLRRLVAGADVVLLSTDVSADDRERWAGPRPRRQVLCDVTAFGHNGPLAGTPASAAAVEALSGVAATTGRRSGPPALLGAPLVEMETAVYAAAAVVAALRARRAHGSGQRVEIASYDVGVNALAAFLPLPFAGRVATRNGNRHPTLAPWNSYRAIDGWVVICAPTAEQWLRLCTAIERPDLVGDPRFASTTDRMDHADDIDVVLGGWVARRTVADCVDVLAQSVIPCGPVVALDALGYEPNLRRRAMVHAVADPVTDRRVLLPGCPVRWRPPDRAPEIPAPGSDRSDLPAPRVEPEVTGDPALPGRPLEGIRVVEIGMNTVGPLAGRQLAALGADVIKVEPPHGDSNRHNAPLRADGQSYIFALLNTDKRGLVLDLRDEADRHLLWEVLGTADVLIENLRPGSLDRLGFGAADVRARYPRLVHCSMNGFGHATVYPGRPALDTVVQAMSGVLGATVLDGVPTKAGMSVSDQLGGLFGLLGVLAALDRRDRDGSGVTLDVAMQDGSAWATHRVWNVPVDQPPIVTTPDGPVLVEDGVSTPVATVADVLGHPQTVARGLLVERPTADGGSWTVLGSPMGLRSTPAAVSTAMPRLGVLDAGLTAEFGIEPGPDGRVRRAATTAAEH